jgi:hypothetical protein
MLGTPSEIGNHGSYCFLFPQKFSPTVLAASNC